MDSNRKYTPHGYHTVTPHFTVRDAGAMIDFMRRVFGADERNRYANKDGFITHAEVLIGDTMVEVSDGSEAFPPRTNTLHIFVPDADACYARALEAGAQSLYEPSDMPYGERSGGVLDPFGNHWYIASFTGEAGKGYY